MRRRIPLPEIGVEQPAIAPFIDIVFQLLVFFMLTMQFSDQNVDELKLPDSELARKTRGDRDLLVVNVRPDGTLRIAGRATSEEALAAEFKRRKERGRPPLLLVRADRSADFERIQMLLMCAAAHGGVTDVRFAASAPEGSRP
jgi:biopolymer transport protein ExbD